MLRVTAVNILLMVAFSLSLFSFVAAFLGINICGSHVLLRRLIKERHPVAIVYCERWKTPACESFVVDSFQGHRVSPEFPCTCAWVAAVGLGSFHSASFYFLLLLHWWISAVSPCWRELELLGNGRQRSTIWPQDMYQSPVKCSNRLRACKLFEEASLFLFFFLLLLILSLSAHRNLGCDYWSNYEDTSCSGVSEVRLGGVSQLWAGSCVSSRGCQTGKVWFVVTPNPPINRVHSILKKQTENIQFCFFVLLASGTHVKFLLTRV